MPFKLFHDFYPELAEAETRTIIADDNSDLPPDQYAFMELYCDDPDCDCRKVIFNVAADRKKEIVAVIDWGWESLQYYKKWFRGDDWEAIYSMKGPILNKLASQSELAPELLELFKNLVLRDKSYINRIIRHYRMFRNALEKRKQGQQIEKDKIMVKRNDPCPCDLPL